MDLRVLVGDPAIRWWRAYSFGYGEMVPPVANSRRVGTIGVRSASLPVCGGAQVCSYEAAMLASVATTARMRAGTWRCT